MGAKLGTLVLALLYSTSVVGVCMEVEGRLDGIPRLDGQPQASSGRIVAVVVLHLSARMLCTWYDGSYIQYRRPAAAAAAFPFLRPPSSVLLCHVAGSLPNLEEGSTLYTQNVGKSGLLGWANTKECGVLVRCFTCEETDWFSWCSFPDDFRTILEIPHL